MKCLLTLSFLPSFFVASTLDYTDQRYSLVKGQSHLRVKNVSEADTGPYACSVGYPNWSSCPPLTSPDAQVRVLDNGGLNSKKKEGRSLDGRSAANDFTSRSVSLNQSTYPISSLSSPFIFFLNFICHEDEIHDFDPKPGTEADVSPPSSGVESEAAGASSGNRSDDYLLTIIVPVIIALLNAGVPDFINRCRRSCQPGLEETGWPNPQTRSV